METSVWQFTLASYVCVGFLYDLVAAQVLPQPETTEATVFFMFDCIVTGCFAVDRIMNLLANSAHWFRPFYTDWQNWFDSAIVAVSVASLYWKLQARLHRRSSRFALSR